MSKNQNPKPRYFSMPDAVDDFRYRSFGAKEKVVAGLKIFGKGLFNATKYTATEVLPAVALRGGEASVRKSNEMLRSEDLSDARRREVEEMREKSTAIVNEAKKNIEKDQKQVKKGGKAKS